MLNTLQWQCLMHLNVCSAHAQRRWCQSNISLKRSADFNQFRCMASASYKSHHLHESCELINLLCKLQLPLSPPPLLLLLLQWHAIENYCELFAFTNVDRDSSQWASKWTNQVQSKRKRGREKLQFTSKQQEQQQQHLNRVNRLQPSYDFVIWIKWIYEVRGIPYNVIYLSILVCIVYEHNFFVAYCRRAVFKTFNIVCNFGRVRARKMRLSLKRVL